MTTAVFPETKASPSSPSPLQGRSGGAGKQKQQGQA